MNVKPKQVWKTKSGNMAYIIPCNIITFCEPSDKLLFLWFNELEREWCLVEVQKQLNELVKHEVDLSLFVKSVESAVSITERLAENGRAFEPSGE